jgi:sulfate transport system ATP-binding protein
MRDGRVEQVATVEDIHRAPASPFVFEFIGRANHLEGQVRDGHFTVEGQVFALPLSDVRDGAAILMFRPHELELVSAGAGFLGTVTDRFRRADRLTLELEIAGQPRALEVDIDDGAEPIPALGDRVAVRPLRMLAYPAGTIRKDGVLHTRV